MVNKMLRPSGRKINELREINIETNINRYAEGSCLISCGGTRVICTASVEERVPQFLKGKGQGWVTAEYSMLPRATEQRVVREKEKQNSRSVELQRLVGRSLRASIDLTKLGERQIIIDCDVIQADGGTRCASITGGFVALYLAVQKLMKDRKLRVNPIKHFVAAVSCGIYKNVCILDFDYEEDSNSECDLNFVLNEENNIIEIQGTAEGEPFSFERTAEMFNLAKQGIAELIKKQKESVAK